MDGHNRDRHNVGPFSNEKVSVISVKQLQRLVRLLDRSDVTELDLRRPEEGIHLVLRKAKVLEQQEQAADPLVAAPAPETKQTVAAPLVGIFHAGPRPKGKPLVAVGDRVKVGQHVAAIESLNVINEVESPATGRIVEILVQEGQPVEYGQPLMTIDSAEGA